jgi:hypothetical protein
VNLDLQAILRGAGVLAKTPQVNSAKLKRIVQQVNEELCKCGHSQSDHGDDSDDCTQCLCISYHPPSHDYILPKDQEQPIDLKSNAIPTLDIYNGEVDPNDPGPVPGEVDELPKPTPMEASVPAMHFHIPAKFAFEGTISTEESTESSKLSSPQCVLDKDLDPTQCWHMCAFTGCQKFWTHGPKDKCRYPDVLNQGLCPNCLNGEKNTFGEDFEEDEKGGVRLLPARIAFVRNATRTTCANMSIEQLTYHILYNQKRIAEFMADSAESRKMRSELEEKALLEIPEDQREAFRQALRRGATKKLKTKEPKEVKKSAKVKEQELIAELCKDMETQRARLVAAIMIKTGKDRAKAEAWLDD